MILHKLQHKEYRDGTFIRNVAVCGQSAWSPRTTIHDNLVECKKCLATMNKTEAKEKEKNDRH